MYHPFSGLPDFVGNYSPRSSSSLSSSSLSSQEPSSHLTLRYNPPRSRHPPTSPGISDPGPFPDPVRKITPPEEKGIHEKLAALEGLKSPYDKAYACVKEFRAHNKSGPAGYFWEDYEEPKIIKMSRKDWIKLSSELSLEESDKSNPRLSYNALTETLIIQCMPSPVHQGIGSIMNGAFMDSRANLPRDLKRQTVLMWEQKCQRFGGEYAGSGKQPGLAIQVRNADNELEIKFVLEAGLSESYNQLVSDAHLWLEGTQEVSMVVFVKFIEVPRYRCPVTEDEEPQELGIPLDPRAIRTKCVTLQGEYGPAIYKGLTWAGEISVSYLETWVRGANGEAVRRGNREDLKRAAQVQIDMGGFLPPGYPPTITLDLDEFRDLLKDKIRELAAERCAGFVRSYNEKMGEGRNDRNY